MSKRHTCPHCGFVTIEMSQAEVSALRKERTRIVTRAAKAPEPIVTIKTRLTTRARLLLRRGVDVPPTMENDWKTFKRHGMSSKEAATALGLPWFDHSEIAR